MEKENVPNDDTHIQEDLKAKEQDSQEESSNKNEAYPESKKGVDLNKSRKGHVVDLNAKIRRTEEKLEELNKSIAGKGIFDH